MERILFAPLTKVVEQPGGAVEVWGRAAAQEPDPKGEVFDYEASKPFIKSWSEEMAKASGGQSLGNLRAMHNPRVAAGKLTGLEFNDADQAVDVVVKVVDPGEAQKVREGIYTGFSFGGAYGPKRQVGNLVYYAAVPAELSLADNPMIKSARFTLVKADGAEEQREFLGKVAPREDVDPDEGKKEYGDVKFADETNKKYPIDTDEHIRAAWNYINKEANAAKYSAADLKAIKDRIIAAWKKVIDPAGPPAAAGEAQKVAVAGDLHKRISDVARMAELLYSFRCLLDSVVREAREEQDASPVPARMTEALVNLVDIFKEFAAEEAGELVTNIQRFLEAPAQIAAGQMALADNQHYFGGMEMATPAELEKVVTEMGERLAKVEAAFAARGETLAKLETENAALQERLAKVEDLPAPPKGVLKTVDKGQDTQPLGKTEGPDEAELLKNKDTLGLIKVAHTRPMSLGPQ